MKRPIKILISLTLLAFACNVPDTIELPTTQSRLVVNCISYAYHPWRAHVSASQDVLDQTSFKQVANATVKIYENGVLAEALVDSQASELGHGELYEGSMTKPLPGKTYKITVESPGYSMIESEFVQPDSIAIESVETKPIGPNPQNQQYMTDLQLRLGFVDPPGEDYYEVAGVALETTLANGEIIGFRLIDPAYQENNDLFYQTLVFDDTYFDGKEVKLDFRISLFNEFLGPDNHVYIVYLRHLSKEYYQYMKTSNLQYRANTDAFAQPVLIENNIKNGYGVFGGFTQTKMHFTLPH